MKERQLKLFYNRHEEKNELAEKRRIIKIPLDTLILLSIINLFIVVISFSMGTEKGRKSAKIIIESRLKEQRNQSPHIENGALGNESEKHQIHKKDMELKDAAKYIIQVACYVKEDAARREKEYLEKGGFSAELLKKGKYIVIYVGNFDTKQDAEETKTILKKRYNDCFVRRTL